MIIGELAQCPTVGCVLEVLDAFELRGATS
jgi:hypothetical protein